MIKPSIDIFSYHLFMFSVLRYFHTIAIALKYVVRQIPSNAAGLGKEITASNVATESAFQHELNEAGVDMKNQLSAIYQDLKNFPKLDIKVFTIHLG